MGSCRGPNWLSENSENPTVANKSINNPQDHANETFAWMEAQVVDINYNVSLLMVDLTNKLELFGEDEGSNTEVI